MFEIENFLLLIGVPFDCLSRNAKNESETFLRLSLLIRDGASKILGGYQRLPCEYLSSVTLFLVTVGVTNGSVSSKLPCTNTLRMFSH